MSPVNRNDIPFPLRPYQSQALDSVDAALAGRRRPTWKTAEPNNRLLVVSATGTGKTVMFSHLAAKRHAAGQRTLTLVPLETVANQSEEKIHSMIPGASVGMVKADRDETDADHVVASIQTLGRARRRERFARDAFGLIIVDEAHHSAARTYLETLDYFGAFQGTHTIGFTATPVRSDDGHLGDVFQEIPFSYSIVQAIRDGWLVDIRCKHIQVENLEVDEIARSRGDLAVGDLGNKLQAADAGNKIAEAYLAEGEDRAAIGFAPTVPTARQFAQDMLRLGISAEVVTAETPSEERAAIYERSRLGVTKVIWSVGVLTEGFDAPWISCIIMARLTESEGLFIQCIGRGLRLSPEAGKVDCLLLDVVGVSQKHRIVTLSVLTRTPDSDQWIEVGEDETLAEAIARTDGEMPEPARVLDGALKVSDVDLLASASTSAWLRTRHRRTWFIPVTDGVFFFVPDGHGTFTLGRMGNDRVPAPPLESGLTLDAAFAWGTRYAEDEDPTVARRAANWRTRKAPPSEAQLRVWEDDIPGAREMTKAQLSDEISILVATRLLKG